MIKIRSKIAYVRIFDLKSSNEDVKVQSAVWGMTYDDDQYPNDPCMEINAYNRNEYLPTFGLHLWPMISVVHNCSQSIPGVSWSMWGRASFYNSLRPPD